MVEWYLNQKLLVKIILPIIIVVTIVIAIVFIPKYTGPEENCVFITEKANLHDEYYITVLDVNDNNTIYVLKNSSDTEKSEIIGTDRNYVSVKVLIEHQKVTTPKENHVLDLNDFILKDHTGVQIKNFNLFSKENGLALETKDFSSVKPIVDYSWLGKEIASGESLEITLYYSFSKNMSVYDTIMVLESDFFVGRGKKAGTDIVLAYRKEQ